MQREEERLRAEVERQLDKQTPPEDVDPACAKTASKLIERAAEKALEEARISSRSLVEAAKAEAEAFADKAIERAVVDAEAITKLMMPRDVEENARLKSEVRSLEAEVVRQGRIIRILSKVLKAVLPESYLSKVRRAFHFESEKVDPSDIFASASVLDDQSP